LSRPGRTELDRIGSGVGRPIVRRESSAAFFDPAAFPPRPASVGNQGSCPRIGREPRSAQAGCGPACFDAPPWKSAYLLDATQLIPLIEAVPPIRGKRGQPLRRPRRPYADRGYDHDLYRDRVRRFEITPHIARRGTEHGSGRGVCRWVVEGTIALLHWFRRLRIRWEIRDEIHHAFVTLGCAVICWRRLKPLL
jgi:hypothetical protein